MRTSSSKTPGNSAGFTLVEVVLALLIIGLVASVVVVQGTEAVRGVAQTRDERTAWCLAAWKMGEIERDTQLLAGTGGASAGGFEEVGPEYEGFEWDYEAARVPVETNDPANRDEQPKEIFHMKLRVRRQGEEKAILEMEGMFPVAAEAGEETKK